MAVSAAAFFVAPPPVNATPITYTLSNATATFTSPSGTINLTGTYTYDVALADAPNTNRYNRNHHVGYGISHVPRDFYHTIRTRWLQYRDG